MQQTNLHPSTIFSLTAQVYYLNSTSFGFLEGGQVLRGSPSEPHYWVELPFSAALALDLPWSFRDGHCSPLSQLLVVFKILNHP